MKEVWAYVKWQHKIYGNGIVFVFAYSVLGVVIENLGNNWIYKVLIAIFFLGILLINFGTLYDKSLKKHGKIFPISKNERILGVFIYFFMTLLVGIGIAWLCTNMFMFLIIELTTIIYVIKNGAFDKENLKRNLFRKV